VVGANQRLFERLFLSFYSYMLKIQGEKEFGNKEFFFGNQQETKILEGYNLINGVKL
jgi:hypothetical protein